MSRSADPEKRRQWELRAYNMLREYEWGQEDFCPWCLEPLKSGHAEGCEWALLLADADGLGIAEEAEAE